MLGKLVFLVVWAVLSRVQAEEGMWLLNNFPSQKVKAQYGFLPTEAWLESVRLSSVRLAFGCSASFVSPHGLIMTNHHCATQCLEALSTPQKNYIQSGYLARIEGDEIRCPNFEANQLVEITDVTARIRKATAGLSDQKANEARKAEFAKLEKECATSEQVRCDVVTLYGGGRYELYRYRRFQDLRLVFAPEVAIAFFGGDPDNFMFPRYNLDVTFLRAYDQGKPASTPHYFPWSSTGVREGDLTFVSGHPGGTDRQLTIAQLELDRDFVRPYIVMVLSELRGNLTQFQQRGPEQKRISQAYLLQVENSLKANRGEHAALLSKSFFEQLRAREKDFQRRVLANPKLAKEMGSVWRDMEKVVEKERALFLRNLYLNSANGYRSTLFLQARHLLRLAEELAKPNEKRLEEYTDARLPQLRQLILSPAPIHKELEIEKMTFSFTKMVEALGPDDPDVRMILGRKSPREVATALIQGTRLDDVNVRKRLLEAGKPALDSLNDPMIAFASKLDALSRRVRKEYEEQVESPQKSLAEKLAKARFAVYGTSIYPDATFTLRLSYGSVKGWVENGKPIPPFTTLGGVFERHTGSEPFALPDSWLKARNQLNLETHFNFVTTNDIVGGNSGSPVINRKREIVGLIFDGNIHSLGGNFGFDSAVNRAVAVDSTAVIEALEKIYDARRLLEEIRQSSGS